MKAKEIFELKIIPEITEIKNWDNYKKYYVSPKELKREDNLVLILSYDKKWNSYNIGYFKINERYKNKEIKSKNDLKDLKLVGNLSLVKTNNGYEVEVVGVDEDYRGQNLGIKMYKEFLKNVGYPIISDFKLTKKGLNLWKKFYFSNDFTVKGFNKETNHFFDVEFNEEKNFFISHDLDLSSSDDYRLALFPNS